MKITRAETTFIPYTEEGLKFADEYTSRLSKLGISFLRKIRDRESGREITITAIFSLNPKDDEDAANDDI